MLPSHSTPQRAFTLVEILVVMVISAILMAIAVTTLMHMRRETTRKRGANAARVYAEAVRAFQLDHDGRPPNPATVASATKAAEWPASAATAGPLDTMHVEMKGPVQTGTPYIRGGAPETV
ncbi:MAG: hypothetical protein JWN41_1093, partial [Thermoleophilia bacterium]|nr:hypothetical protein [Thermoleophilia bacterium]